MGGTMTDNEKILYRRAQQWKMAFFSLVILIAGILIGSGVTLIAVRERIPQPVMDIEAVNEHVLGRLQEQLNLNTDQREQIRDIFAKHIRALRQIRQQARPKVAQEMNDLHMEVMAILDEEQQQIWQQNINRLRNRFLSGRGPGRGPGGSGRGRRNGSGPHGPFPPHRPFEFWEQGQDRLPPDESPPPPS